MTTWRYIKGSGEDFKDYSDNVLVIRQRQDNALKFGTCGTPQHTDWLSNVIAQRERVTSVNDDRLVQALIAERGSRYGKFADGAEIMQYLKSFMHKVDGWNNLTASQKEALDMIQHKIGRILNGDPTYDDNWKDIAGYATLIVEELNGVKK